MRLASAALLCGLLLSAAAAAGPEVTPVPAPESTAWKETRVPAGKLVVFAAAPASTWEFVDDTFSGRAFESGAVAAFVFPKGEHRVIVRAPTGASTKLKFVAGDGDFTPPDPKPSDALVAELRDLYAAETSATKKADAAALAALYALMVKESKSPAYPTAKELNARFVAARDEMLSDPDPTPADPTRRTPVRLPTLRKRCGVEVAAVIGGDAETPITGEMRTALAAAYSRLDAAVRDATK